MDENFRHFLRENQAYGPEGATDVIAEYAAQAHGIIHVGANIGQERDIYAALDLPVIWIEPLDLVFELLRENIASYPKQQALQYLCTDRDGDSHQFGVSNNICQSSSIFNIGPTHKKLWPLVGFIGVRQLTSITLATVIERHRIDLDVYDTLLLDVQGAELLVLKGAGDYLTRFKYIITEAADFDAYVGGCTLADLDAYLVPRAFILEELVPEWGEEGVGTYFEAIYRNSLAP